MRFYLAYGSNVSIARLGQRIAVAREWVNALIVDRRLAFHKIGQDGSGKCDIPVHAGGVVHGVVYRLPADSLAVLDRIEGVGAGYRRKTLRVRLESGEEVSAETYVATAVDPRRRPFSWYLRHVLEGARAAGFPATYIDALTAIESVRDPDAEREARELSIYHD
ncbi:gamma-glutamylcyclotransferase family protein [Elongatibacter sediminis]|uniref:Gamma-glutamylcyclotransferase family protein n=1 Tax=Elongatibacter sediminis TaxID=3119006 RepID=A0AAW9RCB6_9GAMM